MTEHKGLWLRLDNAAKLYPAVRTKNWSNVFRLSVNLTERVDPQILQTALEGTIKRFPSIAMRLCRGFFWYYLEGVKETPRVIPESPYPCVPMKLSEIRACAFRVLYFENRIAVEIFHSITDGNGGLVFLKSLTAEYLSLKYKAEIPFEKGVYNREEEPTSREIEDSFLKNDGEIASPRKESTAYKIRGKAEQDGFFNLTTGIVDLKGALSCAKQHGVSLTAFLVSVMIYSIIELQNEQVKIKKKQKPVKVLIPVNLRKYFDSETLRNFVLYVTPGIDANMGSYTFDEIVKSIHHQMKLQLTKKQLRARITTNVNAEKNHFLKVMPLFIKNIGIKISFLVNGEKKSCLTMSNLGAVEIPEEMEEYVERFDFILGVQEKGCNNSGILSYKDNLYINLIRNIHESELERLFFTNLVEMGIQVSVESNLNGR